MDTATLSDSETIEMDEGVSLTQLALGDRTSVQHFRVEPGATIPQHSHHHEQAGFITAGTARFTVDGVDYVFEPGDSYVIPGDVPHGTTNEGDEPVEGIEVFDPPRPNPDLTDGE